MIIGSPVYFFILKYTFNTRLFLLVGGVLALTWNSTWMIAIVHLFWRSRYVRTAAMFITGLEFSLVDKSMDLDYQNFPHRRFFKLTPIKKDVGQEVYKVRFEMLENQRRYVGLGWTGTTLPMERSHYTSTDFEFCCGDIEDFPFPNLVPFKPSSKSDWKWLDPWWEICKDDASGEDGWIYYDKTWGNPSREDSIHAYTRTRKLTRTAKVIITHNAYS
ncbi:unnamed protein product [Ambrosiozyma monospora]|uniref:Unnamed protein product n=1 Tax=Ambrosiozyma monospora TaxID=43982 RepID=A0ACB5U181_AMBMO|nr:unnamed protein product [Ambrosiozyma monospora]